MESQNNLMSQLVLKFPFKAKYFSQDFYVSSNNFKAYKLIESWPKWPDIFLNVYGPSGCGKTHLSNIFLKKINSYLINAENFNFQNIISNIENKKIECLIIDNYDNNINEKEFYSVLNYLKQSNKYLIVNSLLPLRKHEIKLKDLLSRFESFIEIGIELPTDDLLRVIISKFFSDKQIELSPNVSEFIIKNIERSYEKVFKFLKNVDELSLSSGKSININLIKKVINK